VYRLGEIARAGFAPPPAAGSLIDMAGKGTSAMVLLVA
jgi:hypothetical protein